MDGVTAVIVTYRKDLDKFARCMGSIMAHGKLFQEIVIVVNDDKDVVPLFKQIGYPDKRIRVLHWSELAPWSRPLDWWSQQYFKLAVAQQISTPWYLLVDSDDIFVRDLDESALFDQGRARGLTEDIHLIIDSANADLLGWLNQARRYFGLEDLPSATLGNLTPMMMHTQTVRDLFDTIGPEQFDTTTPQNLTLEFYLYHAWLEKYRLLDKLYAPVRFLGYALDKRGN